MSKSKGLQPDSAVAMREAGIRLVRADPVLASLSQYVHFYTDTGHDFVAPKGWIAVSPLGMIWLHPKRRAEPQVWARMIATALVCLGFGLVRKQEPFVQWEIASLLVVDRFCEELKLGNVPEELRSPECAVPHGGADALLRQFCVEGCEPALLEWHENLNGGASFFCHLDAKDDSWRGRPRWPDLLADGIARGVGSAIQVASGAQLSRQGVKIMTNALRAKQRLIDHYPLLGALAASFDIEEDPRLCQQYEVRVAAIDVGARRIWMNPVAGLSDDECMFVFAHELLHAGLNHASRRRGRDPLLWNIACDFIINGWLIDMAVGVPPSIGLLHDTQFNGKSSEEVYDSLAQDIRRARKLATLRGVGEQDMIGEEIGGTFTDAETYCRRALAQGFDRYTCTGHRGTLPAGLIEEIRSISQPPIPWDVRLAEWFDEQFPPPEPRRSYARPSRRQTEVAPFGWTAIHCS